MKTKTTNKTSPNDPNEVYDAKTGETLPQPLIKRIRSLLFKVEHVNQRLEQLNHGLKALKNGQKPHIIVGDAFDGGSISAQVSFNKELATAMIEHQRDGYLEQQEELKNLLINMNKLFSLENIVSNIKTIEGRSKNARNSSDR